MCTFKKNIDLTLSRIANACKRSNRPPRDVGLLAVSKTKPATLIRSAFETARLINFGENYLQEALQKQPLLQDLPLIWHFIGPIQSRKAKDIAKHFNWVHSVDRLKVAESLSKHRPADLPKLQICIQVNVDNESTKSGCNEDELFPLAKAIYELPHLTLRGLMAIPQQSNEEAHLRASFSKLRKLKESLNQQHHFNLDTLSMGMSEDFEIAIEEGATWVRVGSALFGARTYN